MLIRTTNLSKSYEYYEKSQGLYSSFKNLLHREKKEKIAVKDVSFEINEGEIVGFIGPNGAGKTTTLKMLSGILHPTDGTAEINGYTPWERNNSFKKSISIVLGQKGQLIWDLPPVETFYLNKKIYEISDSDYNNRLEEFVELLDVKDLIKKQSRRLSLGERMKMELIAALIHYPKVLFLDEPTIGLDIVTQNKIHGFLSHYNESQKATILLTSHYTNDIERLCKRSIIINKGEILFDGETKDIDSRIGNRKYIKFILNDGLGLKRFAFEDCLKEKVDNNYTIEVENQDVKNILTQIYDNYDVQDLSIENIPLEEALYEIYKN